MVMNRVVLHSPCAFLQGTTYPIAASPGHITGPAEGPVTTRSFEVLCPIGHYCTSGVALPCPSGRFGSEEGLSDAACSGGCTAGYYCPAGSATPQALTCADGYAGTLCADSDNASCLDTVLTQFAPESVYCPAGVALPMSVPQGYLSLGNNSTMRSSVLPCSSGTYCVNGVNASCPAGRFGCADRLSDAGCNGPCAPGYYCPPGSVSIAERACGGNATVPDAAMHFCPQGSPVPLIVGDGNYSIGSADDSPHLRSGQAICPTGTYCSVGVKVSARIC